MGVHGLWDLLAPVGRRVSVETLAGKRLAIDASIWMIQFMKAMRDEKGEMVRYAHLLGFFRRICKLLYLRTKPVFIFDGGTPALKRRTVIARRRQRENAQAKIRKTAEKLLLNQLKQIRLNELAVELEKQRRTNDAKGKKVVVDEADMPQKTTGGTKLFTDGYNQEALDEMLAASLAAEEEEGFTAGESSSCGQIQAEEEEDVDEDEEMILPTMHGKVDPAILAALPPSMQLDLLVQMRERLMAENRQKYQRVKKVPARFSELQIQAYLKTVAFRREIDEVQKSAAGRGIGGVQTSRIASEANREFIFSTNFSGDKQVLTSTGEVSNTGEQSHSEPGNPSANADTNVTSKTKCSVMAGSTLDEPQRDFENDVETYVDERGRVRVSRVRAMGIRMTRDLQRNLDLMKEVEEDRICITKNEINECTNYNSIVDIQGNSPDGSSILETSNEDPNGMTRVNEKNEEIVLNAGTSMEISFEDNGEHELGGEDDDLFAHLVAGDPIMEFSVDNSLSKRQSLDSASEPEWEDGDVEDEGVTVNNKMENKSLWAHGTNDEPELDWEEGSVDIEEEPCSSPTEYSKSVSKGSLEEEANLKEAIRRSLQDLEDQRFVETPNQDEKSGATADTAALHMDFAFIHKEVAGTASQAHLMSNNQDIESSYHVQENINSSNSIVDKNILETNSSFEVHLTPHLEGNDITKDILPVKACQSYSGLDLSMHDVSGNKTLCQELNGSGTPLQEKNVSSVGELTYTSGTGYEVAADGSQNISEATVDGRSKGTTHTKESSGKDLMKDADTPELFIEGGVQEFISTQGEELFGNGYSDGKKEHIEITEARLEEEMLVLGEDCKELEDKKRKLERNAESVSSEMFAECQELLQIFGLPFIIAPMEAEAQCAYMELVNLVDGVVTDDCDAFLFGARNVYKNIFDDRKYVETYFMKEIENELGLNREKLIRMALLLGSDYTEGVSGIGIVNAIEVVNAFPEEDGLLKFCEWIESPDPSILGKFDFQAGGNSKQIQAQVGDTDTSCSDSKLNGVSGCDGDVAGSEDEAQKMKQIFMNKHRNVSKNWHVPLSFPSDAVILAYSSPQVDKSTEPFSWGKPDHFVLRKLCWEKFGWSTQKADELLLPVLKEYNKRETQLRLEAFYTFNERFAKIRSKRIKKAVKGITGKKSLDLMNESVQGGPSKKKRRVNQVVAAGHDSEKASRGQEYGDPGNLASTTENLTGKESRNARAQEKPLHSDRSRNRLLIEEENSQTRSRGASVRGRGRGGGKYRPIRKGRRKSQSSSEHSVSGTDDENNGQSAQGSQISSREPHEVRRSGRPRKEVNYTVCDLKSDDSDQDDGSSREDNEARKELSADLLGLNSAAVPSKISKSEHINQELTGDCLKKGDGLCVGEAKEEMGTGQLNSSPSDDIVSDTQLSNEYLTTGGGFCLDEDDTSLDLQGLTRLPMKVTTLESDPPNCSDLGEDDNNKSPTRTINPVEEAERKGNLNTSYTTDQIPDKSTNGDRSEVAILQDNINEDEYGKDSSRFLRAMPNLRRKRRKN